MKDRLRVDSRMMQILWGTLVTLIAVSLACRVAFHLGGGGSYLEHLIALFDVDMEQNLPTVFAMLLLAFAAQLFGFAAVVEGRTSCRPAWAWWVLSGVLLMMAVDEAASLHEKLIEPVRSMIGEGAGGIFHYAWVIPGAAFVLVAAPFLIRFVLSQPPRARRYMFLAGALYVTGALGLEFVGGAYADVNGTMNLAYGMITLVEESLEMVGVILLIQGVFAYLAYAHGEVSLGFGRMQVATPVQDRNGSSADRPAGASVGVRPPAQAPLPVPSTPPPREELA